VNPFLAKAATTTGSPSVTSKTGGPEPDAALGGSIWKVKYEQEVILYF
jgi:hypothetical protein